MQPTATPPGNTPDIELGPGTNVDGYGIENKIGEGGMGIVYGARHPRIGKRVAIKVLAQQFCRDHSTVQRFEQEARFVNEIHHPNIVEVYQFGELPDGRKYIVMEWLEGESLSARIERGPIPPPEAAAIIDAISDALEAVHEKNIVHRDLKSDNVFLINVRGQTMVKLLDFGLAKLSGNDPRAITKTKTGIIVGTPHYMAPEQARGKPVDSRMDIYALGVLSFKMLTAELPFAGEAIQLLIHHLKTPPPSPSSRVPGLPESLSNLVVQMMAKEPEMRPSLANIRRVCDEVRSGRALAAAPGPAQGQGQAPAAGAWTASSGRRAFFIVLIALGVVLAGAMSFIVVRAATG